MQKVLIAHTPNEDDRAEELALPIREAGYEVAHRGTVLVGDSITKEAEKLLGAGCAVVLCATVRSLGTKWARLVVSAARNRSGVRVFVVHMEEEADIEGIAFGEVVAEYWKNPTKAMQSLLTSLRKHYPLDSSEPITLKHDIEQHYRNLLLQSCDIVDLANLPESDRHIATSKLALRRLYVALRVQVEFTPDEKDDEAGFDHLEKQRAEVRRAAAFREREAQFHDGNPLKGVPIGERLAKAQRLVILGDPGAGKTTLIRWIATAYLLRLKQDPDWTDIPDVATLPDADWLPIIIRCRELNEACLHGNFHDILSHTLRRSELSDDQSQILCKLLHAKLQQGEALLLLDGLDEITDPAMRARFCKQLEQIHLAYPAAPMIATSRIVGYREMGYRIQRGFEHVTIADLSKADKDDFARRWCAITELPERRESATADLIRDIHGTERIERLTGNPMLLTTMALVKRKIGRLPNRRADLYWAAVEVLLNWRSEVDKPLDQHEAIPQLEYIAYAMCDRGVQQLRQDEILKLLRDLRKEYRQIHALKNHTPEVFLRLLESRTGILIESGHVRHKGRPVPVYEFRHLTFQEYLAGLALVDGRFPGRNRSHTLAQNVAPLAGRTARVKNRLGRQELAVTENWREALRLCVTSCNDDDVNEVILAILKPALGEDPQPVARPRAVLAAQCLADEPNVSDDVAEKVLEQFVHQINEKDTFYLDGTTLTEAVNEIVGSRWQEVLGSLLITEFIEKPIKRQTVGHLYSRLVAMAFQTDQGKILDWLRTRLEHSTSDDERGRIEAALYITGLDNETFSINQRMIQKLCEMLDGSLAATHAGAWALWNLSDGTFSRATWHPSSDEIGLVVEHLKNQDANPDAVPYLIRIVGQEKAVDAVVPITHWLNVPSKHIRQAASWALGEIRDARAVDGLLGRLDDEVAHVRHAASKALGNIGDSRVVDGLLARLDDEDENVRRVALQGLAQHLPDELDRKLLSMDIDNLAPFLDIREPIDEAQVDRAASALNLPADEIRQRYEALAERFPLRLAWRLPQDDQPAAE